MSSWKYSNRYLYIKPLAKKEITSYHDTSSASNFADIYLEYVMFAFYSKKLNEACNIWDPTGTLRLSLKSSPLVKFLNEKPSIDPNSLDLYKPIISGIKINEIQKVISNVFEYNDKFNTLMDHVIETLDLKRTNVDISIHLTDSISLDTYVSMVRTYQETFAMQSLLIFVMGNLNLIKGFKALSDSTWNIIRIKQEPTNDTETFIQAMAEIKMVSKSSSMILDFSKPISRLIYLLRNYKDKIQYFKEINGMEWFLV